MKIPRAAQEAVKVLEAGIRAAAGAPTQIRRANGPHSSRTGVGETGNGRALFISVKPRYADAILQGRKTVELRRTRPNLPDGSLVFLYSSTPTRAVVGWARLIGVREGTPLEIWDEYGHAAAIDAPDYEIYFDGAEQAFALELDCVVIAAQQVPLSVIRSIGIQPPQSWRYVPADVTTQIQESALA
ncbi:ASCH domain-containing protein [Nocardioides alkalitolerans]|uniref:ASCH domain-containing protein n=1 Tax=Nocardioides alkalitolerans TaxID=281714 RepID=UPI000422FB58|nr:ASCH domain-containing protein [Nocardioides alkalitolerans]